MSLRGKPLALSIKKKLVKVDLGGIVLFISSIVCLFLRWSGAAMRLLGLILKLGAFCSDLAC
jgi:hypothetical protein